MTIEENFDYIIIGSGFGGSVSAMRLSEKGYKVLVIEKGRRWKDEDFPKSNWNIPKFLWFPWFNWLGFQKINVFNEVAILSGAGVGGGSLVYANTHMFPPDAFFENPVWSHFKDWKTTLLPFYEKARFMLGSSKYNKRGPEDEALRQVAIDMGREHTYGGVDGVGVYFGNPNKETDPYFKGLGPMRRGCKECAGCMVGCRENAKNTLEKNYIYFAEKFGATVLPETTADRIEFKNGEYKVYTQRTGVHFNKQKRVFKSKGLIISAGVLGTNHLLFNQRDVKKTLPNLSPRLGENLLTNSEQLVGIANSKTKLNNGVAISVVFNPDEQTHIELCKYPDKSGFMWKLLMLPASGEGHPLVRSIKSFLKIFSQPQDYIKMMFQKNVAGGGLFLLVMQHLPNSMQLELRKGIYGTRLTMKNESNMKVPAFIKSGQDVLERYAKKVNGSAFNPSNEVVLNLSSTAHILGGCPMGKTAEEGVVNDKFEVHNYPNMYILDGSIMPCNLGVNPSLTITTLTEYAMSHIPEKEGNTNISLQKQMEQLA